jgi:hypothetical protein
MSVRNVWSKQAGVLGLLVLWVGSAAGNGPVDLPSSSEPRVPVATVVEAAGLLTSEGSGEPFQRLVVGDKVFSRDLVMVLPGLKATLAPPGKAVALTLLGNLPALSDSPVLESAVILHDTRAYDLDFSLLRGRLQLTNTKKKGPARVWLRRGEHIGVELTLPDPGDSIALEIYGRWPPGVPFDRKKPDQAPTLFWEVVVLKGSLDIKAGKQSFAMSAPPGPACFRGDSLSGPAASGPQRRTEVPAWADPKIALSENGKKMTAIVEAYRDKLKSRDAQEAGAELLAAAAKDPDPARGQAVRLLYVYAQAAMDNVPLVLEALTNDQHDDIRRVAVVALRHWIGAAPGRDERLYELLLDSRYSKAEAETIMQLLHSPFAPEQPETYETLIAYLKHGKLAVRELAAWHLYRLAPAGREIKYDAAAPAAAREEAAAAWKKLIPSGELPPKPKKEEKKE